MGSFRKSSKQVGPRFSDATIQANEGTYGHSRHSRGPRFGLRCDHRMHRDSVRTGRGRRSGYTRLRQRHGRYAVARSRLHQDETVHGILLAGGSAFGLEAASGVRHYLERRGAGVKFGGHTIPIVVGGDSVRPEHRQRQCPADDGDGRSGGRGGHGRGGGGRLRGRGNRRDRRQDSRDAAGHEIGCWQLHGDASRGRAGIESGGRKRIWRCARPGYGQDCGRGAEGGGWPGISG